MFHVAGFIDGHLQYLSLPLHLTFISNKAIFFYLLLIMIHAIVFKVGYHSRDRNLQLPKTVRNILKAYFYGYLVSGDAVSKLLNKVSQVPVYNLVSV